MREGIVAVAEQVDGQGRAVGEGASAFDGLPFYMTPREAAQACRCHPDTLKKWRRQGWLKPQIHFVRRAVGRRGRVLYVRTAMRLWMESKEAETRQAPAPIDSKLNPAASPAIAAALLRERTNGL
jgi:hypothetical protein